MTHTAKPLPVAKAPSIATVVPGQVAGVILQNPGAAALAGRIVSFAMTFADGAVPAGKGLRATFAVGGGGPVQLDVTSRYADGSVRMAMVTLAQPALAAGQSLTVGFTPTAPVGGAAPSLAQLAASGAYHVGVALTLHDASGGLTAYSFDAATLLANALAAGTVSYWQQGPLATQARVSVPVSGSLRLTFDITLFADGNTSTDIRFDNDAAMQAQGGTATYDVAITQNGQTVLQQSAITQYQYTSWDHTVWSNGPPRVNVQQDIAALERTGAVPNYDLSVGVSLAKLAFQASLLSGPSYGILGNGGITKYMPLTGGRPDIGPQTGWATRWLVSQNATAATIDLAQANLAGSVPWHLFNPATGSYATANDYPTLWDNPAAGPSSRSIPLTQAPATGLQGASGWTPDAAHQPDLTYTAYLMTGDRVYLDELNAQASWDILSTPASARQGTLGIVMVGALRAQAWDLRELIEAATVNPDGSTEKAYFSQVLSNNISYLLGETAVLSGTEGEVSGWFPSLYGRGVGVISAFQEDFIAIELGQAAALGVAGAATVLGWMTNFIAGRFLNGANGFTPYDAVNYTLQLADATTGAPYGTWAQVGANNPVQTKLADSPDYQSIARAALATSFTWSGSTQALQAYGWLLAYGTASGAGVFVNDPTYDIVPRLADGQLLSGRQVFIAANVVPATVKHTSGDVLIYERGPGNVTLQGGNGIDILFGGAGVTRLIGGTSGDYLFGGAGATTFQGGAGDDFMQVGKGAATIDLNPADAGSDRVAGFRPGTDHLAIVGASPGSAALATIIGGTVADANGNAVLPVGAHHSVTLLGIASGAVTGALFA